MNNIRNFSIIAHIDHGKSTLADRFLELTGTVSQREMKDQILDQMDLERERGITIKMQPCTFTWCFAGKNFILNLIDTPGHMDFAYEVERALHAVEGALLLVDVTKGIQAQTLACLRLAQKQNLSIIGVINKIDICPSKERLQQVKQDLSQLLSVPPTEILTVSAKTGFGTEKVLNTIVQRIPPPQTSYQSEENLRALVFDSYYDNYLGVVAFVRIFSGSVKKDQRLLLLNKKIECQAKEVGILRLKREPRPILRAGEVGYIATGIKEPSKLEVGETIVSARADSPQALPGYQKQTPRVFADLFPGPGEQFSHLKSSLAKLHLNDSSLDFRPVSHPYLGRGLKVGFLGMLHLEISLERLRREYQVSVIVTAPSVVYRVVLDKEVKEVFGAGELPSGAKIKYIEEPWVELKIISPVKYQSQIHSLLQKKRGVFIKGDFLDSQTLLLVFQAPLSEIIQDFLDKLKSVSEGFASFSYKFSGYQKSDLVKLEFLVAHEVKPVFSRIVHRTKAESEARRFLSRLKEVLPQQNFAQVLQARVDGRVIAREDIKARRKDVTAGLYGGDFSRKKKLLVKQRRYKKEMAKKGRVNIPDYVYLKLLSGRS